MLDCYYPAITEAAIPITLLTKKDFPQWLDPQSKRIKTWVAANGFKAKPGKTCLIPTEKGELQRVLLGIGSLEDFWTVASLASDLPKGQYYFDTKLTETIAECMSAAWGLQTYRFDRYKKNTDEFAQLIIPEACKPQQVDNIVQAIFLVRDLINTPTEDMGPAELAAAAMELAKNFSADIKQVIGSALLTENFPAIHTVGRASASEPRLVDLQWGEADHPKVTLVGKGVCFDSGGLNIKLGNGMRLMKKDMGGAAHVLGLARLIMSTQLPVRLRVLIPAVENAISGNAYRPGDIIATRKGSSVEVDNTDAEGRIVLADALYEAAQSKPELIIDFATLTGAARIALGTDLPAMFTNQEKIAKGLIVAAEQVQDPLWRLPLHAPYKSLIESKQADLSNTGSSVYGGAITAALFLQHFIPTKMPWVHFDLMAWNSSTLPGRPEGGEAMALRAVFKYLCDRF